MKVKEAKALANEFNQIVEQGRVLWEQAQKLCVRCSDIREQLDAAGVEYDPIALLFGGELDVEVVGDDDAEIRA